MGRSRHTSRLLRHYGGRCLPDVPCGGGDYATNWPGETTHPLSPAKDNRQEPHWNVNKTKSISELLSSQRAGLKALNDGARAAEALLETVHGCLDPTLRAAVWSAAEDERGITLLVRSPAYATRLHYALPELKDRLRERLARPVPRIALKVRPAP